VISFHKIMKPLDFITDHWYCELYFFIEFSISPRFFTGKKVDFLLYFITDHGYCEIFFIEFSISPRFFTGKKVDFLLDFITDHG